MTEFQRASDVEQRRVVGLRRLSGGMGLALATATWPLWANASGPRIPVLKTLVSVPTWFDRIPLATLLAGLAAFLALGSINRAVRSAAPWIVISALTLVLLDQQRFQPWLYHLALLAILTARGPAGAALRAVRWLAISVYFYSALSRFDATFLDTIGREFLGTLLGFFGRSPADWSDSSQRTAAIVFPVGELLTAACLAWPRTRRVGLALATVLHLALIAILGPLGLDHRPGVLLWNVLFLVQDWLVFARPIQGDVATNPIAERGRGMVARRPIAATALAWAIAWPLAEPFGWCDHWPAWSLYAPRASRAVIAVSASAAERLGEEWQPFLEPLGDSTWLQIKLDRWSLEVYRAPLYPQDRVQVGIAEHLARRFELGHLVRVERLGPAHRISGERTRETIAGLPAIVAAGERFMLNSHPRSPTRP